jgi:transposase
VLGKNYESKINTMMPLLNEKQKRIYLASEAIAIGRGGVTEVSRISGISRSVITAGIKDINDGNAEFLSADAPIRRKGAGRKPITETQPGITEALEKLVCDSTFGDPMSPLLWTTKSIRKLADELVEKGFKIGYRKVAYLLEELGYSLQKNQKMNQVGDEHPDRDAQFRHINEKVKTFGTLECPVISIDCKKKELVGNFQNVGREYAPKKHAVKVLDHDFPLPELGKAAPYGVYDISANEGYVSVGISADTAQFAVASIRSWWYTMGMERYPHAPQLLITADGGGSNGSRNKLWKTELQALANEIGLKISVCHFPPGTSKWNKIEHRMFSQISQNWRGRPLESLAVIVSLIAATTTKTGLTIQCQLDLNQYPKGIKVSDDELASVNIVGDKFHPNWNYTILPQTTK